MKALLSGFNILKGTLLEAGLKQCPEAPTMWSNEAHTLAVMIHVDDLIITGKDEAMDGLLDKLKEKYKVSIETGAKVTFLKRLIEVDKEETRIWLSEKYAEGLVGMFHGVKRRRTPGEIIVDDTLVEDPEDVSRFRSAVGILLYIAGDRPDLQFHTKELAGKLQKPTIGAMTTLKQVIGYLVGTSDIHAKMTGRDPSRSFRERADGVSSGPQYENAKDHWLLEVATDSDWNGNKQTRASTSCGSIFIGGNWIYSYSRTQKCVTLSSTEAEYIALVSGASEGLLVRAVLQHLTGETVDLKVYSYNTSCVAVAQKEGVGRIKHLDGRLLWLQQRQGRDLELRRLGTLSNPADLGTKPLASVRLLLYLLGFSNVWDDLGQQEMREEMAKKEAKDRIRTIKTVIHPEVVAAGEGKSSTLVTQVAKKLLRLTLAALLAEEGGALGQSSDHCYVAAMETTTAPTTQGTIFMLSFVIFIMVFVMAILLRFIFRLQRQIVELKEVVMNIRQALRDSRDRWRGWQIQSGVYFEESEDEVDSEDVEVNVYSVRVEETMDVEENAESEMSEETDAPVEVEVEVEVDNGEGEHQSLTELAGDGTFEAPGAALALLDDGYGGTTSASIPTSSHAAGGRGAHGGDGAEAIEDVAMDMASEAGTDLGSLDEMVQE